MWNARNSGKGDESFKVQPFVYDLLAKGVLCFINGCLAAYNGKTWVTGKLPVMSVLASMDRSLSIHNLKDALAFAEIVEDDPPAEYCFKDDPYLISCGNGVLDMHTMELQPFSNNLHCCTQIPWNWVPEAKSSVLDDFLSKVSGGDQKKVGMLLSCVASVLFRKRIFQVIWILKGEGSNGKSVFLNMLRSFFGERNCSSVSLAQLSTRFGASSAMGHLLNANAEMESERISASGQAILKNMASGDYIAVEAKGQDLTGHYAVSPLPVFSCNTFPQMSDRSDGFSRRLRVILFNARMSPNDKDFDLFLEEKLADREVMEALFVEAAAVLLGLLAQKYIGETDEMAAEKEKYLTECSSVLSFLDNLVEFVHGPDAPSVSYMHGNPMVTYATSKQIVMAAPIVTIYKDYYIPWCKASNRHPVEQPLFSQEVGKRYQLKSEPRRIGGIEARYFCEK
jgi:putative DNA primase/helicase